MCHTNRSGDGCYAKGVGGCGGNLLQSRDSSAADRATRSLSTARDALSVFRTSLSR